MAIKQIKFYDKENERTLGGIKLDDGSIICGCCGSLFEPDSDEIEIIREYSSWVDIADSILGEDNF